MHDSHTPARRRSRAEVPIHRVLGQQRADVQVSFGPGLYQPTTFSRAAHMHGSA